jgi:hypothetical protein
MPYRAHVWASHEEIADFSAKTPQSEVGGIVGQK